MNSNTITNRKLAIQSILNQINKKEIDDDEAIKQIFNINIAFSIQRCSEEFLELSNNIFNNLMDNIMNDINKSKIMTTQEASINLLSAYTDEVEELFDYMLTQQKYVIENLEVSVRQKKTQLRLVKNEE